MVYVESEVRCISSHGQEHLVEAKIFDAASETRRVAYLALQKIDAKARIFETGRNARVVLKVKKYFAFDAVAVVQAALGPHTFRDCLET